MFRLFISATLKMRVCAKNAEDAKNFAQE
jgi:hypothetical protein